MLRFFKTIFSVESTDIADNTGRKTGFYGGIFLAIVSVMLTALNIYKQYWIMTGATTLLAVGFAAAAVCAGREKIRISRIIMALLCGVIFSLFALTGANDGFAILWILLVPLISYMLIGLRIGFFLSLYFQIFLIVLFYTPLSQIVSSSYTSTFIMRFPLLYFATFGTVSYLMYQRQLLYNRINQQANFDALTGLANRHYYNQLRENIIGQNPGDLTVFSIDINGLKEVNDTLGHEAGDELICGAAKLITDAFAKDECCRVGGDEFMVISRRKDAMESVEFINREMADWKGKKVESISLSIGAASSEGHPEYNIDDLIRLSDEQMYKEKSRYYRMSGHDRRGR